MRRIGEPSKEHLVTDDMAKFEHADSWILLSIGRASEHKPVDLEAVIESADQINHSVPSITEIEGALNRLASVGLISVQADCLAVTQLGKSALEQAAKTALVFEQWDFLEKLLCATTWPDISFKPVRISEHKFNDAYENYRKKCQRVIDKIIGGHSRA